MYLALSLVLELTVSGPVYLLVYLLLRYCYFYDSKNSAINWLQPKVQLTGTYRTALLLSGNYTCFSQDDFCRAAPVAGTEVLYVGYYNFCFRNLDHCF